MRTIHSHTLIELKDKYGNKPFCKVCEKAQPVGIIKFAVGWRAVDPLKNLYVSNLEPACYEHADKNIRTESVPHQSGATASDLWSSGDRLFNKSKRSNHDSEELGKVSSSNNDSKEKTGTL